uniref:Serine protease 8 n=1 Tax=Ursus maritimus TaxID=29073 RepID=A0A452UEB8_URSMA
VGALGLGPGVAIIKSERISQEGRPEVPGHRIERGCRLGSKRPFACDRNVGLDGTRIPEGDQGTRRGLLGPSLGPSACREHLKEDYEIKLGAHQLDSYSPEAEVRMVAEVIPHTSYNQEGSPGDIALLRLSRPVTFSRYIRPICLPAANASFPNGLQCTVTGWASSAPPVSLLAPRQLQQLEVPLISRETCNCLYNIDAKPEEPHFIQQDMLCAGYVKGGKDACQGDSGGPLSCPVGGLWYLAGIVSWGDACGAPNRPGVYTLTSSYASWIHYQVTELQPRVVPQPTMWAPCLSTSVKM